MSIAAQMLHAGTEHAHSVVLTEMQACPLCQAVRAQNDELVRLAAPLFKEELRSIPFYAAKLDNEDFWRAYLMSRKTDARARVARLLGIEAYQGEPAASAE